MKKFLSYLLMLILVASCLSIPAAANAEDWITLRVECFDRSVSGLSVESNLQHDYIQKKLWRPQSHQGGTCARVPLERDRHPEHLVSRRHRP